MKNYISKGWKIHKYDDGLSIECFNPKTAEWKGSFIDSNKHVSMNYPFLRGFPYHINVRLANKSQLIDHIRLKELISEASEKGTFYMDFVYKINSPVHPNLIDILEHVVKCQIHPTISIHSGQFNNDIVKFAKENLCEVNIISCYGFEPVKDIFHLLIDSNIKTILNLELNDDTIDDIVKTMNIHDEYFSSPNFKQLLICRNPSNVVGPAVKEKYDNLYKLIIDQDNKLVTYDKCARNNMFSNSTLKTCICGRRSLYINYDLKAKPCKHDYNNEFAVDLRDHTLEEAWNSEEFKAFRNKIVCDENKIETDSQGQLLITKCPLLD